MPEFKLEPIHLLIVHDLTRSARTGSEYDRLGHDFVRAAGDLTHLGIVDQTHFKVPAGSSVFDLNDKGWEFVNRLREEAVRLIQEIVSRPIEPPKIV